MKKTLLLLLIACFTTYLYSANKTSISHNATVETDITDGFVTTWQISADGESITIPINDQYAFSFDQNLGDWDFTDVVSFENMIDGSGLSKENYAATINGWASQQIKLGAPLGAEGLKYCDLAGSATLVDGYQWVITGDKDVFYVAAVPDANGIVYVDSAVVQPGDGSSWTGALKYLSDAIASVNENAAIKEIHIAKGTYYPTGDKNSTNRNATFDIKRNGIKLIGGFPSGGGQRDFKQYKTVLSGDIGVAQDTSDNCYSVAMMMLSSQNGTDSLVLDGLNITAGNAFMNDMNDPSAETRQVGGLVVSNPYSTTNIRNCNFYENYGYLAAAFAITASSENGLNPVNSAIVENTVFRNNGTGLEEQEVLLLQACVVYNYGMPTVYKNCDFIENKAAFFGVVTNLSNIDYVNFYNCRFLRNSAQAASAIGNVYAGKARLINCLLAENVNLGGIDPQRMSGGELNYASTDAVISNFQLCNTSIVNSTIVNNSSVAPNQSGPGYIYNIASVANITNSIIWGNASNFIDGQMNTLPSTIQYSLVGDQGPDPATHMLDGINADPLFKDQANGDYQLMSGSATIDAGFNDSLTIALNSLYPSLTDGGLDLNGNTRLEGGVADLGAYEYQATLPVEINSFSVNWQSGLAALHWNSGVEAGLKFYEIQKATNGKDFVTIGRLNAKGSNHPYKFTTPQSDPKAYYRIKATDALGINTYSPVKQLSQSGNKALSLYPNPATNYIQISIEKTAQIHIYNASGAQVKAVAAKAGLNKIDIRNLSAGVYFVNIDGKNLSFMKE